MVASKRIMMPWFEGCTVSDLIVILGGQFEMLVTRLICKTNYTIVVAFNYTILSVYIMTVTFDYCRKFFVSECYAKVIMYH